MGEIHIKDLYCVLMKNNLGNVKECKTLIKHHHVKVNGQMIDNIRYKVHENDIILVDENQVSSQPFVYYMLNKPKGYVCANKDKYNMCVVDLIKKDCFCIGRLDKDTTGLLLLSNDSSLSKKLLMPQFHVEKTYLVKTLKRLSDSLVERFKEGIIIDDDVKCQSAVLSIIDDYHCYVTLHEGKFHQVKKMFLSCDNLVVELKRISFGGILLDEALAEGEYRSLTKEEFHKLKEPLKISI
ncbi:MAG: RNA pseudouridine synthase [Coprobacillus sp.]